MRKFSRKAMQALTNELKGGFSAKHQVSIILEVFSCMSHFGLYAPGAGPFDWRYFDSWEELVTFVEKLIKERRAMNEKDSINW